VSPELSALVKRFPLPPGSGPIDVFSEHVSAGGLTLHLVGLMCDFAGESFAGSAVEQVGPPWDRAFFELIERVSIGVARRAGQALRLRSADGNERGQIALADAFPASSDPEQWRYALSNGMAVGPTWQGACERALAEAVERDAVMRSWYGELALAPLPAVHTRSWEPLLELFELEVRCVSWLDHWVVVACGFPLEASTPTCVAFGARRDLVEAADAARREVLQRLGFLWGEELPTQPPEPSPSPDYHQEFSLWPGAEPFLRRWLARSCDPGLSFHHPSSSAEGFLDLTPPELRGKLYVARVWHPGLWPLVFGRGFEAPSAGTPVHAVHPIA
jgi:hypothetical protein